MSRDRVAPLRPSDPDGLGPYVFHGRLGQGGMGTVYLARDPYGRRVAVKVVHADLAADAEFRARFRSEVERARQVPPFCTAEVLDADPGHATPYLVVEYVDGPTLAEVIADRGPLAPAHLHALSIGVATALTAIHGAGVVHRDLKPRNVLLAPVSPKVIDFGIARALTAAAALTRTNQLVGTVAYMAPERFDTDARDRLGPAADVFAWGAVIAYAGTGRTPFHADSPPATAARILTQPPDLAGLHGELRNLVALTLAKDPADRPSAREVLDLLLGAGGPALPPAPRVPAHRSAPVRSRRRWALPAAGAAAVLGIAAAVAFLLGDAATPAAPAGPPSTGPSAAGSVVFADALARPGPWQEEEQKEGSCTFGTGGYRAGLTVGGYYLCDGPAEPVAGAQSVAVDVTLGRGGACASIFFLRSSGDDYHELETCARTAVLNRHTADDVDKVAEVNLDARLRRGTPVRVELRVAGEAAELRHDGLLVGRFPVPAAELARGGRVTLGVYGDDDAAEPPYDVTFRRIEVRRLS